MFSYFRKTLNVHCGWSSDLCLLEINKLSVFSGENATSHNLAQSLKEARSSFIISAVCIVAVCSASGAGSPYNRLSEPLMCLVIAVLPFPSRRPDLLVQCVNLNWDVPLVISYLNSPDPVPDTKCLYDNVCWWPFRHRFHEDNGACHTLRAPISYVIISAVVWLYDLFCSPKSGCYN